jgi:hypothetical protein
LEHRPNTDACMFLYFQGIVYMIRKSSAPAAGFSPLSYASNQEGRKEGRAKRCFFEL